MNQIKLSTRNLLLESGDKKIIIDTGMGNKWDEKIKNIYTVDENISIEIALY